MDYVEFANRMRFNVSKIELQHYCHFNPIDLLFGLFEYRRRYQSYRLLDFIPSILCTVLTIAIL